MKTHLLYTTLLALSWSLTKQGLEEERTAGVKELALIQGVSVLATKIPMWNYL